MSESDDDILERLAKLDAESQKRAAEFVQNLDERKRDVADWLEDAETFANNLKAEHGDIGEWQQSLEAAHRKRFGGRKRRR